jgi:peptidoglycan-associated lipoprotein
MTRRGLLRGRAKIGALAALGLAAMACSTANSTLSPAQPDPGTGHAEASPPAELRAVYFEVDSAVLREEGRAVLAVDAKQIQSNPDWGVVTIEGHCDERGSAEYNLALGERRAAAVKQYLADLGVPPDRLDVRSFGEMEPASLGHDERAWRLNRRVQLETGDAYDVAGASPDQTTD